MEDRFADKFKIKSSRLQSWDYSASGVYFVTICSMNHNKFFGVIKNYKMCYSNKGLLAYKCLIKIPIYFTEIDLINYVIMPNHVHILLKLRESSVSEIEKNVTDDCRDVINYVSTKTKKMQEKCPMRKFSLGTIIRWYKAKTTREIRNNGLFFAWQSRYYDEIIESEERLRIVKYYIKNNPKNWEKDKLYN